MKLKKKKLLVLIVVPVLVIGLFIGYKSYKRDYEICTYKWVKEEKSSIGQYRLYVSDNKGKHVKGRVMLTYLNGKSKYVDVSVNGNLYVKNVIKKVSNPRRRK